MNDEEPSSLPDGNQPSLPTNGVRATAATDGFVNRCMAQQTEFDRMLEAAGRTDIEKLHAALGASDSAGDRLLAEHQAVLRSLEERSELGRIVDAFAVPSLSREAQAALDAAATLERQLLKSSQSLASLTASSFILPERLQIDSLLATTAVGSVTKWYELEALESPRLGDALKVLEQPWLRLESFKRSLDAMVELQGIGKALSTFQGFEVGLANALRSDFGDWRPEMDFSAYDLARPDVRYDLYLEQGLKPSLVEFPEEAFVEGLSSAGLSDDDRLKGTLGTLIPEPSDADERANEQRAQIAFKALRRLERALRDFIDGEMTRAHGEGWEKHRLTPEVFKNWKEKAQRAKDAGEPFDRLIDFADFSDYALILCRRDDFGTLFRVRFRTIESVRESFNRLAPLRIGTMHSRVVNRADVLYALVESSRLLNAIAVKLPTD